VAASLFVLSGGTLAGLDLDTGAIHAVDVDASTDPPFPLLAQGGWVVYRSHGRTTMVRPDLVTDGGRGWPSLWFVPSGRAGSVWDVFAPGGGWSGLPASVSETLLGPERRGPGIDASVLPAGRVPLAGWRDGLVLGSDEGIEVWDPADGSSTPLPEGADLVAATGGSLAWCEEGCDRLHLVDAITSEDRIVPAPPGMTFGRQASFSPGGGGLALSMASGPEEATSAVAVVDGATGAVRSITTTGGPVTSLAWTPSGDWLIVAVEQRGLVAVRPWDGLARPVPWRLGTIDALASM
jgi:hypothetical protein